MHILCGIRKYLGLFLESSKIVIKELLENLKTNITKFDSFDSFDTDLEFCLEYNF